MKRLLAVLLIFASPLMAHCNCKLHSGGGVRAQHGGEIEITDHHIVVELVVDGSEHAIYLMDENLRTLPVKGMDVEARILFPRGCREPQELVLKDGGNRFLGGAQLPEGLHRYVIEFDIKHDGHEEQVRFVVEP